MAGNPHIKELGKATRFKKGVKHTRTRKGVHHLKTLAAQQFYRDAIATNKDTGKPMRYVDICKETKQLMWKSGLVCKHVYEGALGKAVEYIKQQTDINIRTDKGVLGDSKSGITVDEIAGTVISTNDTVSTTDTIDTIDTSTNDTVDTNVDSNDNSNALNGSNDRDI